MTAALASQYDVTGKSGYAHLFDVLYEKRFQSAENPTELTKLVGFNFWNIGKRDDVLKHAR